MQIDFLHARLGNSMPPVFRLGLSATYRPGRKTIYRAIDAGVNYLFCFGIDTQMTAVLRDVLRRERERYVVATGAYNYVWWRQDLRRTLEKRLGCSRIHEPVAAARNIEHERRRRGLGIGCRLPARVKGRAQGAREAEGTLRRQGSGRGRLLGVGENDKDRGTALRAHKLRREAYKLETGAGIVEHTGRGLEAVVVRSEREAERRFSDTDHEVPVIAGLDD